MTKRGMLVLPLAAVLLLGAFESLEAQVRPGDTLRAAPAQAGAQLTVASFSAEGLNFESEFMALYLGDFANARLARSAMEFSELFSRYLDAFARRCDAHLPPNKVEITRQRCTMERVTRDGFGNVSRDCIEWVDMGTGLYADPDLYAAARRVSAEAGVNMLRDLLGDMAGGNPMGRALDLLASVPGEMESLLRMNSCDSPGLKRFQENMMRFALNQQPLRLAGGETLASIRPSRAPGAPVEDSDYTRLLDDLVAEQSRSWMTNRYESGSVSNVRVTSRDDSRRPAMIVGDYLFHEGFTGARRRGSVRVEFADGLPRCMYFSDFPRTCRSPSRRIVTAYETGRYQER